MTHKPAPSPTSTGSRPGARPHGDAEPVEIAVLSFRTNPPQLRTRAMERLLPRLFATNATRRLVLFPGFASNWPTDADSLANHAGHLEADILFEECLGTYGIWRSASAAGSLPDWRIAQRFGSSAEANRDVTLVRDLVAVCGPGGERRLDLAGSDVGLLCCGENNVLQNAQSAGNAVSVRHDVSDTLLDGARIVFNGAHSNMGNWGKLNRRFEWLSAGPRLALYATNNGKRSWTSSLGAWWGGERLASGSEVLPAGRATCCGSTACTTRTSSPRGASRACAAPVPPPLRN